MPERYFGDHVPLCQTLDDDPVIGRKIDRLLSQVEILLKKKKPKPTKVRSRKKEDEPNSRRKKSKAKGIGNRYLSYAPLHPSCDLVQIETNERLSSHLDRNHNPEAF